MSAVPPPALADFLDLVRQGVSRGGHLLTAGEGCVVAHILALDGPPALLYARLTGRVPSVFRLDALAAPGIDDAAGAAAVLVQRGLADRVVPPSQRARASTRARLAEACRALGLPVTGRKELLAARLADHSQWDDDAAWLRVRHRALVRRLERWALLEAYPDRGTLVATRIGAVRWPPYTVTPGPGLFRDRRRMRAWEALLSGVDAEHALTALLDGTGRAPGRLDLRRGLVRVVRDQAAAQERADPTAAAALYAGLAGTGAVRVAGIAVRWARCVERSGRVTEAMQILREARISGARPSEHEAIGRAGRRLGRALRTGLPPPPPLARPGLRSLPLTPAEPLSGRPRWQGLSGPRFVEAAVSDRLEQAGRSAIRAEAAPWATLFSVLCAELYFLPVAGSLPMAHLSGPLDLGTAAFRPARQAACEALLAELDAGRGPERVRREDPRWRGTRLAGARWEAADPDVLETLASGLGPRGLRMLVETLLDRGPRGAAGLPDLVVLPGPEVRLPEAHPTRIPPSMLLVEVKGPGDAVRDEQLEWHDRLVRAGVPIEVWEVSVRR